MMMCSTGTATPVARLLINILVLAARKDVNTLQKSPYRVILSRIGLWSFE